MMNKTSVGALILLVIAFRLPAFRKSVKTRDVKADPSESLATGGAQNADQSSFTEKSESSKPEEDSTKATSAFAWIGGDNIVIDAAIEEKKLLETSNVLMAEEHVIMAFKVGRTKTYFTSKRILFRPKGWLISSSIKYKSTPYQSIAAFSISTAGIGPGKDTELKLWTEMDNAPVTLGFKSADGAEFFAIMKFMNSQILGSEPGASLLEANSTVVTPSWDEVKRLVNGGMSQDVSASSNMFKEKFPILQQDETLDMALHAGGYGSTLLTSKRILRMVSTGNSIEFHSFPWVCVRAFSVKSQGFWNSHATMTISTSLRHKPGLGSVYLHMNGGVVGGIDPRNVWRSAAFEIKQGLTNSFPGHIAAIQNLFAKRVLSTKERPRLIPVQGAPFAASQISQAEDKDTAMRIMQWLGGDQPAQDTKVAEANLRATVPILQDNEHVELAFSTGFKRRPEYPFEPESVTYLTTHRILSIDSVTNEGTWTQDVEYTSLPYESISAFAVQSDGPLNIARGADRKAAEAANIFDCANEVTVWTEISPPPLRGRDKDGEFLEAEPGMTERTFGLKWGKCQFGLKSGSDLWAVQGFLYAKVLGSAGAESSSLVASPKLYENGAWNDRAHVYENGSPNLNDVHQWLSDNAKEITTEIADGKLRNFIPILQPGETVQKAFRTKVDMIVLTSTRALIIPYPKKKTIAACYNPNFGVDNCNVPVADYKSLPYASIGALSVNSGIVRLYTKMPWMPSIDLQVLDKSNLKEIQTFFGSKMLGSRPASLVQLGDEEPKTTFFDWLGGNAHKIDAAQAGAKLLSDGILEQGEEVRLAYKVSKVTTVFTTLRILSFDHHDLSKYMSIPIRSVEGFSVSTAASYLDADEEVVVYTAMPKLLSFQLDIKKGNNDIFDVQKMLSEKILA